MPTQMPRAANILPHEVLGANGWVFGQDHANIFAALIEVQREIHNPPLDSENPHFRSKFTSLSTLTDHLRMVANEHGLAISQHPIYERVSHDWEEDTIVSGMVGVCTLIMHESGEWMQASFQVPIREVDPQKIGSIITYLRRYSLACAFNVQGMVDDDAESVSGPVRERRQRADKLSVKQEEHTGYAHDIEGLRKQFFAVAHSADLDVNRAKEILKKKWQLRSFNDATEDMLKGAIDSMRVLIEEQSTEKVENE